MSRKVIIPLSIFVLMAGFGMYKYMFTEDPDVGPQAFQGREEPVYIGVERDYAPFAYMSDGRLIGFDVDMSRNICKKLKLNCVIKSMEFPKLIPMLREGRLQMIVSGLSRNAERERYMNFTDPYYTSLLHYIAKSPKIGTVRLNDEEFRARYRIGVQDGSSQHAYIRKKMEDHPENVKTFASYREMLNALLSDKVDVIMVDGFAALEFLTANHEVYSAGSLRHDDDDMDEMDVLRIAVGKKYDREVEAINKVLRQMRQTGEYQEIAKEYFPFIE